MLSRAHRLTRRAFKEVFRSGVRVHNEHFSLVMWPAPHFCGAVVVSKKVAKRAVVRNKIRRRVYHLLRAHFTGTLPAFGCIVMVKAPALVQPFAALDSSLAHLITRATSCRL